MTSDDARRERAQKFGERLRERREELGLKQDHVGRRMSDPVSGNVVSRWERGVNMPRDRYVIQLADVLGVNPDYLWGGNRPGTTRTPAQTDEMLARLEAIESRLERLASIDEHMARLVAAVTGQDEVDVIERAGKASLTALGAPAETPASKPKAPARKRRAAARK